MLILLVRQGYLSGELDGDDKPTVWTRTGTWSIGGFGHILDLVSEWVPPKKWVVKIYTTDGGGIFTSVNREPDDMNSSWKLAGSATVTEGEFAKDTQ